MPEVQFPKRRGARESAVAELEDALVSEGVAREAETLEGDALRERLGQSRHAVRSQLTRGEFQPSEGRRLDETRVKCSRALRADHRARNIQLLERAGHRRDTRERSRRGRGEVHVIVQKQIFERCFRRLDRSRQRGRPAIPDAVSTRDQSLQRRVIANCGREGARAFRANLVRRDGEPHEKRATAKRPARCDGSAITAVVRGEVERRKRRRNGAADGLDASRAERRTGDVQMLKVFAPVKASGGIRTREQAMALVEAGAERLGTSATAAILGH